MARLVIGTDKTATTAAFIKEIGEYVGGGLTIDYSKDVNDNLISYPGMVATCGVKGIKAQNLLQNKFTNSTTVTTVDFDSVEVIDGDYTCNATFFSCANLTSLSMANLTTIMGTDATRGMFDSTKLPSVVLPSLQTLSGTNTTRSMFGNISTMTSLSLPSLTTITGEYTARYFAGSCTSLTSVSLPVLSTITGNQPCYQMFSGCTSLTTLSFPALKTVSDNDVFHSMFSNNMACTVHFPSNLSSYNFNCGGTYTTVLYDLPPTA